MPLEARKFIFTVSLCAMLAVNPVLADKVENPADLGTSHDVYVESTIDMAESGIAGVQYVNRMVGVAGAAAQKAEDHAASAGGSAFNAATSAANAQTAADNAADDAAAAAASAKAANEALSTKVDKAQGADKKNLAMVTDDKGSVYPGYISAGMITNGEEATVMLVKSTGVLAKTAWGKIDSEYISDGAITSDKISKYAVTADKMKYGLSKAGMPLVVEWKNNTTGLAFGVGSMLPSGIAAGNENGVALVSQKLIDASGNSKYTTEWGQVGTAGIADAAITPEKTAGVVGAIPVGAADSTTYGSFWIE